ncbi:hypothetical protein ABFV99_14000 [Cytobacillus horneckiae]|uniref:hypothetical protein n=1 Tax=Cytobacillus horneckiae TaxID=549687 RepID=UPI0034CFE237
MNDFSINNSSLNGTYFNDHDEYPEFELSLQNFFNRAISGGKKLFTTNVTGLYELYLNNLPSEARQHYACNACKNFIERFGGLVTIDEDGTLNSAMWNIETTPSFFAPAVATMKSAVLKSRVNGVFIPESRVLGVPRTGEWTHLSLPLPQEMVNRSVLRTAHQVMAEKKEDFKMLMNALLIYPLDVVEVAVTLLQTESLYRSEKILGVAEWFSKIHVARNDISNTRNKENLVWLAVATAPAGFCHIKSSMIGTLLDDIISGISFDSASRRFAEKMNPLKYQRPQAAPSAGNIAQAEKIVEKLGIQNSLVRRFARLDEIKKLWTPSNKQETVKTGGVFSHLQPNKKKTEPKMDIPAVTMTWRKFSEMVLPLAEEIEYFVRRGNGNYSAILTAEHEDAPPILKWDNEEQRNPFSWYVYSSGSSHSKWGLTPGYCKVTGISLQPSMWYENNSYQGKSVFFLLEGAKDIRSEDVGNALFPETLKSELREIRSTIEAYSKGETIHGFEDASACGVRLQSGSSWDAMFRVTTKTGTAIYKLDRWD